MNWTKIDIINELSAIHGYRKYLEICTPTTGRLYGALDRNRFPTCHRLMYRCPAEFDDGLPIDLRSPNLDIADCVETIRERGLKYEVILVDPFHEYELSARDLREAFNLLPPNGTIVVHDCFPRDAAIALPVFHEGDWCGVTYKAYLDFVLANERLTFCTIDTDYGCGVVRPNVSSSTSPPIDDRTPRTAVRNDRGLIVSQWKQIGDDFDAAFRLLQAHAGPLLNLVTVDEFLNGERNSSPVLR